MVDRRIAFAIVLMLTVTGGYITVVAAVNALSSEDPTYSVKYLCGALEPLPSVLHWTEINIYNPTSQNASINKRFLVSGTENLTNFVPSSIPSKIILNFVLTSRTAVSIDCDEIWTVLGVPVSTPLDGYVELTSNISLQVTAVYNKCTLDRLIDVFDHSILTATLQIGSSTESITLVGSTVIGRESQINNDLSSSFFIGTRMISMELSGTSSLAGGAILVVNDPTRGTYGGISGRISTGQPIPPFPSFFGVYFNMHFENPTLTNQVGFALNNGTAILTATNTEIVPAHPTPSGENKYCHAGPIVLLSSKTGTQIGSLTDVCHIPNPPFTPRSVQHPKVGCSDASIDVEYIPTLSTPPPTAVGAFLLPVDKLVLLAPYIGSALALIAALIVYRKRVRRGKQKD